MIRYRVRPEVWKDVDRASNFILERDPDAVSVVSRFYDAVEITAKSIADFPLGYTSHSHYRKETKGLRHRFLSGFKRYTVYYQVAEDGIPELVRILHGARDHGELFKRRKRDARLSPSKPSHLRHFAHLRLGLALQF